ncbi:MAG: hypothetical protein KDD66_01445 [Bdellovibrionales bacterium]|nr:hypothetical protein [Bdellovibrionales bacterium]
MMFQAKLFKLIFLLLLFCSLSACAGRRGAGLVYQPTNVSELPSSDFTIAVVPFTDRISGVPRKGTYFSDQVAYGLLKDLRKSDAAKVVHFSPEMLGTYDLVIDGTINSLSDITYRIQSPYKEFAAVVMQYTANGKPDSEEQLDVFRYFTKAAQENNEAFLKEVAPAIKGLMDALPNLKTVRTLRYYYTFDPELETILRVRAKEKAGPRRGSPYYQRLVGEIKRRQTMLGKYQALEEDVVGKKQNVRLKAQEQRIQHIQNLGSYERQLEEHEAQIDEMNSSMQMSQVTGAIVSGLMPTLQALGSAAAGGGGGFGTWHREHTLQALQDTSTALSAAPKVNLIQKPDYTPYYANLEHKAYNLKQLKVDPFAGTQKGSILEMRKRFLQQYNSKIVPLDELR